MIYSSYHYAEALYETLNGKSDAERRDVIIAFTRLLQKNRQIKVLPTILHKYEQLFLKKQNVRKVEVESVTPLSEKVKKQIETILGSKILLREKVNPELIAGLTILVDDSTYIDASARNQINNLFI